MFMKIFLFFLMAIFVFNEAAFSQWASNEDPLTISELRLTKLQQKIIKNINREARDKISLLSKNNLSDEEAKAGLEEITGARIKQISNNLNEEQQIIWRKKMLQNKPRRGVTGLPYERVVQ